MQHAKTLDGAQARRNLGRGDAPLLSLHEAMVMAMARVRRIDRYHTVPLAGSIGRRLAGPLAAHMDLPPFDQSAMDGYALFGPGHDGAYLVSGEGHAGDLPTALAPGQAARIATGARIPAGADRVVMWEHAILADRSIALADGGVAAGANIRQRGEDIRRGEVLLRKGARVDARKLALLAAQGLADVDVLARPRVAVLSSGNELRQPGEALSEASLFDSNRSMLMALAAAAGADVADGGCWPDEPDALADVVSNLSQHHDLIVLSGGSSFGDHDVTALALRRAGAEVQELRIAMKPGKPALIGNLGATSILSLPGNPVAAFVSWFTLGRSMMAEFFGLDADLFGGRHLQTINVLKRRSGRTEFVPARRINAAQGELVELLGRGGSASLSPLARADGLVCVEAERGDVLHGERVQFIPFDDGGPGL